MRREAGLVARDYATRLAGLVLLALTELNEAR
jgi:hypothetical protein